MYSEAARISKEKRAFCATTIFMTFRSGLIIDVSAQLKGQPFHFFGIGGIEGSFAGTGSGT
jgi:hypothetical protein